MLTGLALLVEVPFPVALPEPAIDVVADMQLLSPAVTLPLLDMHRTPLRCTPVVPQGAEHVDHGSAYHAYDSTATTTPPGGALGRLDTSGCERVKADDLV